MSIYTSLTPRVVADQTLDEGVDDDGTPYVSARCGVFDVASSGGRRPGADVRLAFLGAFVVGDDELHEVAQFTMTRERAHELARLLATA